MKAIFKVGIATLILILGIIFGGKILLPNMASKIFEKAVNKRLTSNPLQGLDDGLHGILIGTGSPLADPTRSGPSTAVIAGNKIYIIDSGGGAVRKMGELGIPPARVSGVFLTHFHSDHIDGLGELMLQRWAGGGHETPLPVYGPIGVSQVIDGLNMTYAQDRDYRIAHHSEAVVPPSGYGGKAIPFDIEETAIIFEEGDLTVTAFTVDHAPASPAVGYRFEYKGRTISITGDTAYDSSLVSKIKGSELLISEALNSNMVGVMQKAFEDREIKNLAKIMYDIPDYHITPEQAATIAQEVDTDILVFTHIVPALPSKALHKYFLGDAPDKFNGEMIIGEDGMLFSLPAGSDTIIQSRLN